MEQQTEDHVRLKVRGGTPCLLCHDNEPDALSIRVKCSSCGREERPSSVASPEAKLVKSVANDRFPPPYEAIHVVSCKRNDSGTDHQKKIREKNKGSALKRLL